MKRSRARIGPALLAAILAAARAHGDAPADSAAEAGNAKAAAELAERGRELRAAIGRLEGRAPLPRRPGRPPSRCGARSGKRWLTVADYRPAARRLPLPLRSAALLALHEPEALASAGLPLRTTATGGCDCTPMTVPTAYYADVAVSNSVPSVVQSGSPMSWTIVTTIPFASASSAVTLTDNLAPVVTFSSAVPSQGSCSYSAPTVTCNLGILSAGSSVTTVISGVVNGGWSGFLGNTAAVAGSISDPESSNDTSYAQTTVSPPAVGSSPDGTGAGAPLLARKNPITPTNVDLTWGGSCGSLATGFALYQGIPAPGGSFYSHTGVACSLSGYSVTWNPGLGGDYYWLIVPTSASSEGSYGTSSSGAQIPRGTLTCRATQDLAACP